MRTQRNSKKSFISMDRGMQNMNDFTQANELQTSGVLTQACEKLAQEGEFNQDDEMIEIDENIKDTPSRVEKKLESSEII